MTSLPREHCYPRDALHAIYITGKPKRIVTVDELLVFKNRAFFTDSLIESDTHAKDMDMEQRLRRQTDTTEIQLSEELKQLKRQEYVDRKRRQQLRTNCEELRILAEQLRLASITKDLDERLKEKNRCKLLAKNAAEQSFRRAEAERQELIAKEKEAELRKKEQQHQLRNSLSTQIEERLQRRQKQYVETLAEREERMAMQQQIEEEDRLEQLEIRRLKQKKLDDMIESINKKRQYQEEQKKLMIEDTSKQMQKQLEIDEHKRRVEEVKKDAIRKQQEISMRIGHQVFEIEERKRQRDNLLLDLLQAEYKAKDEERYRQQLEQEQFERQQTRRELERYRAEALARKMEASRKSIEETEERNLICPDERDISQIDIQEREKRKEHGALLLSMIEENNRKRAEAAAENIQFFDVKAKYDAEREQCIQEERLKMLSSVPAAVLQYLPKQVLSESDRKYFNVPDKHQGQGDHACVK